MKHVVKVAIVAAMLNSSAYADEKVAMPDTAQDQGQGKIAKVRQAQLSVKKTSLASKKSKTAAKTISKQASAEKTSPDSILKQDAVIDVPTDSAEQTIQLKGLRG